MYSRWGARCLARPDRALVPDEGLVNAKAVGQVGEPLAEAGAAAPLGDVGRQP
jgi:hypothetical protein